MRNVSLTTVMHRIRKHGILAPILAKVHRVEIKYLKNYTSTWKALWFLYVFRNKFRLKQLVSFCVSASASYWRQTYVFFFRLSLVSSRWTLRISLWLPFKYRCDCRWNTLQIWTGISSEAVKIKQSLKRVLVGWDSQISRQSIYGQHYVPGAFTPRKYYWYLFRCHIFNEKI